MQKLGKAQLTNWLSSDRLLITVLMLFLGSVYFYTLLPTVAFYGDTPRFQTIPAIWGVNSPPGAPLYIFIGRLFTFLPVGDIAYRLNVMSAVFALLTGALLYILLRKLGNAPWAAFLMAIFFGLGKFFWEQAITAELYTIHTLFLLSATLCFWHWTDTRDGRWLQAGLIIYAVGFGNHLAMILLLPGLVYWLLVHRPGKFIEWRFLLFALVCALFGASQYLYVYFRGLSPIPYGDAPTNWVQFIDFVTGSGFKSLLAWPSPEQWAEKVGVFRTFLGQHLYLWGTVLTLVGAWVLARQRPHHSVYLALGVVIHLVFGFAYQINDPEVYFMPMWLLAVPFCASGLTFLFDRIQKRPLLLYGSSILAVLLLVAVPLKLTYPLVDVRGITVAKEWVTDFLDNVEPNSLIYAGTLNRWNVLAYGLFVEKPEVEADLMWIYTQQEETVANFGKRPLYTAGNDFWLTSNFILDPPPPLELAGLLRSVPPGYIVILSTYDEASLTFDEATRHTFHNIGVEGDLRGLYRFAHLAVGIQGAAPGTAYEKLDYGLLYGHINAGQEIGSTGVIAPVDIEIRAASLRRGIGGQIYINGENVAPGVRGYNIVILEPETGAIVGVYTRDLAVGTNADGLAQFRIVGRWLEDEIELADEQSIGAWSLPASGEIDFGESGDARRYLGRGWGMIEDWGVWTLATEALLYIHLPQADYRLIITALPFPVEGQTQSIRLFWNGVDLGEQVFEGTDVQQIDFDIPAQVIDDGLNQLRFNFTYAISPHDASNGQSADMRTMAVWFADMAFVVNSTEE